MADTPLTTRPIRSFVIRNGRMTSSQADAIKKFMPLYGIEFTGKTTDLPALFGNQNPVWLEIGFGDGEALLSLAQIYPDINFLGIEVHAPGVGHLLARINSENIANIRVMRHDALEVLAAMIPNNSIDRILLLFPDPWHKKRHNKRRILQENTISLIQSALTTEGVLHCATDWTDYAESMLAVLEASSLHNLSADKGYSRKPDYRLQTKFELRGIKLGHEVRDLLFRKVDHRLQ